MVYISARRCHKKYLCFDETRHSPVLKSFSRGAKAVFFNVRFFTLLGTIRTKHTNFWRVELCANATWVKTFPPTLRDLFRIEEHSTIWV